MEFSNDEKDFISEQLRREPHDNVISKEEFEIRVGKVFDKLWSRLSKSFGPGGAGTFASIYPKYYNSKDGFTIMKNIGFDTKLDQFICDMCMDICSRLNFTVGDGTTSAVIATKSTYESYRNISNSDNEFFNFGILPRDILSKFNVLKDMILSKLDEMSVSIQSDDPDELYENIRRVVYISSNGNDEITNMISSLYKELKYPAISCITSKDGTMHYSVVSGYKTTVSLTDKLYCNNDNNTCKISGANVIIFSHKVTQEAYTNIIKPLCNESRARGKRLICIAPYYDETALGGTIQKELNYEYKTTGTINLVLGVCKRPINSDKVNLGDLAMLLNTEVITPECEAEISEYYSNHSTTPSAILDKFDLDNRDIPNINVAVVSEETNSLYSELYTPGKSTGMYHSDFEGELIRVGYCDDIELGLDESIFSGFYYDEKMYELRVSEAKYDLEEIARKVKAIGTYSTDYNFKQQRVYALGLKTGLIEVGASSEISQSYLKDMVDDAVKAAQSAYNNGVVLGCNVTLMRAMNLVYNELDSNDRLGRVLLLMLISGFRSVYSTVLSNVFDNIEVTRSDAKEQINTLFKELRGLRSINNDDDIITEDELIAINIPDESYNLYDTIIDVSVETNRTFDLSTYTFNNTVINSAETDKEILKATIDLLALLITGNQVVIR